METVSFGLALGSLPGIFTSCVECYRYFRICVEFEQDLEIALCKLDASKVRLDRWGIALGIQDPSPAFYLLYEDKDAQAACHWLKQIRRRFEAAIKIANSYTKPADNKQSSTHQVLDEIDVRYRVQTWFRRMNEKCVKPRKRDRFTWAIRHKERLKDLIEDISDMTQHLVELFPPLPIAPAGLHQSAKIHQSTELHRSLQNPSTTAEPANTCSEPERLSATSTSSISMSNSSPESSHFSSLTEEDFPSKAWKRSGKQAHLFSNIEVRDNFRGHFGDNIADEHQSSSGVYSHIIAGGSAFVHFGNNIGGCIKTL